jgi:hypothetical protein
MILHQFKNRILDKRYQDVLAKLFQNDAPAPKTINVLDRNGMTPFIAYIN